MLKSCKIEELLLGTNIEPTAHRKLVLKILAKSIKANSAQEILVKVRKKNEFDKVTLYRILDIFVQNRIVRRITSVTGSMYYEILCQTHHPVHPHFECRECGDIECLDKVNVEKIKKDIALSKRFKKESIDLKIEGLCSTCQSR